MDPLSLSEISAAACAPTVEAGGAIYSLDQNARLIDQVVYVPNSTALLKDNAVFLPMPNAYLDQATGNYFMPASPGQAPVQLLEVVVN